MDAIVISDLLLPARIGVPDEERLASQNVLVSFELAIDLRSAGESDDLSETLDYGLLLAGVAEVVEAEPAKLIEHLAERVASFLLGLPGVESVAVEIAKEKPPVPQTVGRVSMRVERGL